MSGGGVACLETVVLRPAKTDKVVTNDEKWVASELLKKLETSPTSQREQMILFEPIITKD